MTRYNAVLGAPAYLTRPTIPIAYLELLVEVLAERGHSAESLFAGLPFRESLRKQPRMSALQWTRLVLRAQSLGGDPGLGYEYGVRMRPTAHGLLGYAAMSAGTIRDATDIVVRHARARQAHFDVTFEERPDVCRIILKEKFPIPIPALRTFFYENILLGLARGSAVLLGCEFVDFHDCVICFDTPEPVYYPAWRDRIPRLLFEQPFNAVQFPPRYLQLRPALADPQASREALALCERELALAADAGADLAARVLSELGRTTTDGYPSLPEVAERLFVSTRTLKRNLKEQGTSFSRLLNDKRTRDATELLRSTDLPVHRIAMRLGYENPANFSRAFTRATAMTPIQYRVHRLQRSS